MEWIQTFLIAAEEENFHRTSERLHLAQPTVSLHIRKLEAYWGVELFEREGRNVKLSAAGLEALPHAKNIAKTLKESRVSLTTWRERYRDRLVVAASPIVAHTFLPRWIHAFHQEIADVQVSIQVVESDEVWDKIITGGADIGFARRGGYAAGVDARILYDDPLLCVGPADVFDHDGPPLQLVEMLERYTLITDNHPGVWSDMTAQLRTVAPWYRTMEVSRTDIALHFVEEGLAVSILPQSVVRKSLSLGRTVAINVGELALPLTHTFVVWPTIARDVVQRFRRLVEGYMVHR